MRRRRSRFARADRRISAACAMQMRVTGILRTGNADKYGTEDADFREKYFATERTIAQWKFKEDRIGRLLSFLSFDWKQYLEEKLPSMMDAAQRQIEVLRKEEKEIDIEIGDRQAISDIRIGK